jgi:hypothetical protein
MFKSCYRLIEEQQNLAEQVVEHGNSLVCEYATLIEAHEAYPPYDAALMGIDRDEMESIEELLATFNTEFRCD